MKGMMEYWAIENVNGDFLGVNEGDSDWAAYEEMLKDAGEEYSHPVEIPGEISVIRVIKTTLGTIGGAHVIVYPMDCSSPAFWADDCAWDNADNKVEVFLPDHDYGPLYWLNELF